jgi:hypothetical protein
LDFNYGYNFKNSGDSIVRFRAGGADTENGAGNSHVRGDWWSGGDTLSCCDTF